MAKEFLGIKITSIDRIINDRGWGIGKKVGTVS